MIRKNMKVKKTILMAGFALVTTFAVAKSYSIDWFTIDGGGGDSSGGGYSVSGTIGQSDAGTMTGGNFSVNGGFWGVISAVQIPGAPLLSITRTNNAVIISWPDTAMGFRLENNFNLSLTNGWTPASQSRTTNGGFISISVFPPSGNTFYRLKNP